MHPPAVQVEPRAVSLRHRAGEVATHGVQRQGRISASVLPGRLAVPALTGVGFAVWRSEEVAFFLGVPVLDAVDTHTSRTCSWA